MTAHAWSFGVGHVTRFVAGPRNPLVPLPIHLAACIEASPPPEYVRNRKRSPFVWFAGTMLPLESSVHIAVPLGQTKTFSWKNQMPTVAEPFGEKRVEAK